MHTQATQRHTQPAQRLVCALHNHTTAGSHTQATQRHTQPAQRLVCHSALHSHKTRAQATQGHTQPAQRIVCALHSPSATQRCQTEEFLKPTRDFLKPTRGTESRTEKCIVFSRWHGQPMHFKNEYEPCKVTIRFWFQLGHNRNLVLVWFCKCILRRAV